MRGREAIEAEMRELERLRSKRAGRPGFNANVADIEARIAERRAELSELGQ